MNKTVGVYHFQRGFTFLELILVIALVIILGLSTVPFSSRFYTQNAVSNTVDQITSELRKSQMYAMSSRQSANWGVHYGSNQIVLFQGTSYASRNANFDEKFTVNTAVTVSGLTDVIFMRTTGTPSATPTIIVSGAGDTATVTVNSEGVVNR